MGTWGKGNFDDDTAADHLSGIASRIFDETQAALVGDPQDLEPDQYWGVAVPCNVELLATFAENRWVGAMVPDPTLVATWKRTYLAVWDRTIDGLAPSPSFKKQRRAVLVETFDRLARASRRHARSLHAAPKTVKPTKAAKAKKRAKGT
jgi:hypothetical protein